MKVPAELPRTRNISPFVSPSFEQAEFVPLPGNTIVAAANSLLLGRGAMPMAPFHMLGGTIGLMHYLDRLSAHGVIPIEVVPVDPSSSAPSVRLTPDWWIVETSQDKTGKEIGSMEGPVVHWTNPRQSLNVPVVGMVPVPALIDWWGETDAILSVDWATGGATAGYEGVTRSTRGPDAVPLTDLISNDLCDRFGVDRKVLVRELEYFDDRGEIRQRLVGLQEQGRNYRRLTERPQRRKITSAA